MSTEPGNSSAPIDGSAGSTAVPPARPYVKRRNFFVKKWLQSRYIFYYLAIMSSSSILLFVLIQRYAHRALTLEMQQGHSIIFDTWSILRPGMVRANITVILAVIAVAALTTLALTRTVRRAAGTLDSNVRAYMSGSRAEQWTVIRHPGEFQHLQLLLVKALSDYRDRVAGLHREVTGLQSFSREARERTVQDGTPPGRGIRDLRVRLARLRRRLENIGKEGSYEG